MDVYGLILLVGLCTIVAIGLWYKDWKPEPFHVAKNLLTTSVAVNVEPLEWVKSALDKSARIGNTCGVVESFPDTEVPGAVVEIVDSSCESGLPHTTGKDRIRIPKATWENNSAEWRAGVLRHERIHLLQRRQEAQWREFYKKEWQYTTHSDPPPEIGGEHIRANPDTYPERWACWRNRYWFVPVYQSTDTPTLRNTTTRIWDSQQKVWLDQTPYEWRVQFCTEGGQCPYQSEHPAEMSAEYATDMSRWSTPAAMSLRRFLEQNNL
jgi:hypothetical protein